MNWDTLISAAIIITLILAVLARVSKQTIAELIMSIVDVIKGKTEEGTEYVQETVIYD